MYVPSFAVNDSTLHVIPKIFPPKTIFAMPKTNLIRPAGLNFGEGLSDRDCSCVSGILLMNASKNVKLRTGCCKKTLKIRTLHRQFMWKNE